GAGARGRASARALAGGLGGFGGAAGGQADDASDNRHREKLFHGEPSFQVNWLGAAPQRGTPRRTPMARVSITRMRPPRVYSRELLSSFCRKRPGPRRGIPLASTRPAA